MLRVYLSLALLFTATTANATVTSCSIPIDETKSSPAVDLIENGQSIDQGAVLEQIKHGFDSSVLEPQISDPFQSVPQPLYSYANTVYPKEGDTVNFSNALDNVSGLVRGRITLENDPQTAYQLNFSLDTHAALTRNALFRRLGYAITSPKYYSRLKVRFHTLDERNSFIEGLGGDTLTARERWVDGGQTEVDGTSLVVNFHDLVLEPAVITVPQLHWGILTKETLNSRRSIRALIMPLTLLDIPESVNMYSYEPSKIYNENLSYTRVNADKFKNETSVGDIKWIAKRIAKLTRADWIQIIAAGHYPADISALVLEKTLGRVDQQMKMLQIKDFKEIPYDSYVSTGAVVNGKATQEFYDGYALRFAYGDPQNPLRASEIARFFSIEAANGGLAYYIEKANTYLQALTPQKYIDEHSNDFANELTDHFTNHPDQPFNQSLSAFGGVTAGGNITADRSIVTGTYYGSDSQVQLVDSISASVNVGGFIGVAGISSIGLSAKPNLSYSRSYVHVRPLTDIKSAFKDNWVHLFVPTFMTGLANVLKGGPADEVKDALKNFMGKMKTGESFIITDGFSAGVGVDAKIPVGALLGLISPFSSTTSDVTADTSYTILSRITLYKTEDGIQVYLSRIHSEALQFEITADFYVRILDQAWIYSSGGAHTRAYDFPETFEGDADSAKNKIFQNALIQILRKNNPNELEASFEPYTLEHESKGKRRVLTVGPWSWSKRENLQKLEITPPVDKQGRYDNTQFKRTVFSGQITKINGKDLFGFFSGIVKSFYSFINLSPNAKGDDPSANFLGNSKTVVVDTEVETTPGRSNTPFTKLQQAANGWIMKKETLLKALEKISSQVAEFNPSGGLIDPSEFAETKKLQAYTILWNLLIYEKGAQRVLDILNVNLTNTQTAFNFLVDIMGRDEYHKYCAKVGLSPTLQTGPYKNDRYERTRMESAMGQTVYIGCAPKLLDAAFNLRTTLASHPEVFNSDVRTDEEAKTKIKWTNTIFMQLNDHLEIAQLIRWIGKENSFFQVRISGFRTNDENADFKSAYYSNTVGLIDQTVLGGPISDIEDTTKISSHEVEARYLSNGY